ncbi:MAG: aldolase/citrate lyase family protein [Bryobacteraceae bacterium]
MRASSQRRVVGSFLAIALLSVVAPAQQAGGGQGGAKPPLYNTAKQKLLDHKQIFSFTVFKFDPADYCEKAKHYDYTWFDMQHSTLEFKDIEQMIAACPHAPAIPMIRVADSQEWMIQHATDIGALGIIVPTVDDGNKAREAAKWIRYPPIARRSSGQGQASNIWGNGDYRHTIDDNILLIIMIETPTGVSNADEIASTPGVDVVIIGNNDLTQFSGYPATDPHYQEMITKVHDAAIKAGKISGEANFNFAKGNPLSSTSYFFQNGPSNDGWTPPPAAGRGGGGRGGAAPSPAPTPGR